MNFQNDKYTLKFADASDNAGIREVFESGSFRGNLDIRFLRNPCPYESFLADGDDAKILIIIDNEAKRTIAVGGAVIRREYLNGKPEKCAYLTGLKIHPDYQRKIAFIKQAYKLLGEAIADCRCCYTTILDSNTPTIAMFEKKHKNMPAYQYLGHYTTYCFHGGKRILQLERDNLNGFDELVHTYFSSYNLTPADYHYKGFGSQTFYCVREAGKIRACCFVGDQQAYKQYEMCSYGGIYKVLSKLPTKLFGYPEFPQSGSQIRHGVISSLYVRDYDKRLCRDFLRSVAAETDFGLLLWGGFENHPLCSALDEMKTIRYGSRLYEVIFDGALELSGPIGMEAALL